MLPNVLIISKYLSNKNRSELNFLQRTQWTHISIFPRRELGITHFPICSVVENWLTDITQGDMIHTGHMVREEIGKWHVKTTFWTPHNFKRGKGRPALCWSDEINKNLGMDWIRKARNRDKWKNWRRLMPKNWAEWLTVIHLLESCK